MSDNLQLQRFELKYIVREEAAISIRDFISSYLVLDEYGATQPSLSYSVHSLYLDSDDLTLYWQTINGNKNRYKLRIRFYDNRPDAPVYFEIKRRMNDAILKRRGSVRRDSVDALLRGGQMPCPADVPSSDPKHFAAVQEFCRLLIRDKAKPKAHISYLREAWMGPHDNSIRITMDRQVLIDPEPTARFSAEMKNPLLVFGNKVVLELKFTGRFPVWFSELVRIYGLAQCSAAKYADGVVAKGECVFNASPVVLPSAETAIKRRERLEFIRQTSGGLVPA